MPKKTKKVKFNVNLLPSRRIYKTRRLFGGMEEESYKKNNDHFHLKEYRKNAAKKLSNRDENGILDIERQFSSLLLNNKKRKELKGTTHKQRKTKTQRRRPKTLDDIESEFSSLLLNDKKQQSKTQRKRAKSFGGMESLSDDNEFRLK